MSHRKTVFLFVIDSIQPLGDFFQLELLLRQGCELGIWPEEAELHLAVLSPPQSIPPEVRQLATVHSLGSSRASKGRRLTHFYQSARQLRKLTLSLGPDILHAWGHEAFRLVSASRLALRLQHTNHKPPRVLATITNHRVEKHFLASALDRRAWTLLDAVTVPDAGLKHALVDAGAIEDRIQVIGNAVGAPVADRDASRNILLSQLKLLPADSNSSRSHSRDGENKPHPFIAAAAADLVATTRLKDLIWATDLLNCIRDDFHFVIFGDGDQMANLKRFSKFTHASHRVHFLTGEPEAKTMLPAVDAYWHSHLNSSQPSPMLWAMQNAVPTIAVLGDQTSDLIIHQQTAMAVNYGARDEFARWTKFLIEKPDQAQQLAMQGANHVAEKFGLLRNASHWRKLYTTQ